MKTTTLRLSGLDCPDCAEHVKEQIQSVPGVSKVNLNFFLSKVEIQHDTSIDWVLQALKSAGVQGSLVTDEGSEKPNKNLTVLGYRACITLCTFVFGLLFHPAFLLGTMVIGAWMTVQRAFFSIKKRQLDMNVLMSLAIFGAVGIGEWKEGAMVALLFTLSHWLEARNMDWTRKSVQSLVEIAPKEAKVVQGGTVTSKPVDSIKVGEKILVSSLDRIPLDGIVVAGSSTVDESAINGESLPQEKKPQDTVYAGTLNQMGSLEIEVTAMKKETLLSRIITLVEEAQNQKTPTETFILRFARYYTPAITFLALVIALVIPLVFQLEFFPWVYRGLSLLIIGCPCALILASPIANVAALGNAAKHGILVKGGVHLEQAAKLRHLAVDKTGTLTYNRPYVVSFKQQADHPRDILQIAKSLEHLSNHPLAQAIVRFADQKGIDLLPVENFKTQLGLGVSGEINGISYVMGSPKFLKEQGIAGELEDLFSQDSSLVVLGGGGRILALFAIEDEVRKSAKTFVSHLKTRGIEVVMLTGDNERAAEKVRSTLGIQRAFAGLLPQEKLTQVEALQKEGAVGMIGDGINDAPALAVSDLGIALGGSGNQAALETADVVLMGDNLSMVLHLLILGKNTLRILKQNIYLSLGLKVLALALIVPGHLTLWMAVLADMGASLLVTMNGMRLFYLKSASLAQIPKEGSCCGAEHDHLDHKHQHGKEVA